ncbi:MAG: MFS transporter [Dehalococcoidia bacterium]|nr:MAG: MFS transporter [Dehalococcoidia bacterium]
MLRRALPGVYEGWIVVGSAAFVVLMIGASFFYGFGTIFNEVIDEFGWSVAATSLAFSLRSEVGGIAAPFIGVLIDRLGAQRVALGGVIISAVGVLLMSEIQAIWHFYAVMMVIAIGSSAAGGSVGLVAIASWFEARRAFAMSIMTLGGGVGGLLVVAIAALVEEFGWRGALRALAVIMLTVGIAFAVNIRTRPEDHPQPMDGVRASPDGKTLAPAVRWGMTLRQVMRSRAFIFMSLGLILMNFSTTAVVIHQIPYLEREMHVSKAVAGSSVAFFTMFSIVGRLGAGYLADRFSKRLIMVASCLFVLVGLPILAFADSYMVATAGILIIAPGFGGTIPVRPAMLADYFGTKFFGTINGVVALVTTTGGALGPWLVGWLVDTTGHYQAGWLLSAAVAAAAIPFFLLASSPSIEDRRGAGREDGPGDARPIVDTH